MGPLKIIEHLPTTKDYLDTSVCLPHCILIPSSGRYDLYHFRGEETEVWPGNYPAHTASKWSWNSICSPAKFSRIKDFCSTNIKLDLGTVI